MHFLLRPPLALFSVVALFLTTVPVDAAERPNLVLIIADDMAWDDCGAYGNHKIRTPNIDRMATEGMRFDQAFLTVSSCSPSRASIITGQYPTNTDADELHWPLPGEQTTFVEKLKAAGYWTGAAGKWHLGDAVRDRFDEIREVDTSGFQLPTGEAAKAGKFVESLEGEAQSGCADWIPLLQARPRQQPFFLWLAALDPHRDYHEGILEDPHQPEDALLPPYHVDTPETRADYALYYDEITRLVKYVGRVFAELEAQGVADNTLVLFFSDNGRPFPRDKTSVYDSGIRTPWIVRWPARVEAGSTCRRLVSSIDIAPTMLQLAAIDAATISTFVGESFVPLLDDPSLPTRDFVFAEKNWHDFEDHARAARDERFKYIRNDYPDLPLTPSADSARSPTYEALKAGRDAGTLTVAQQIVFRSPRPAEELYDTVADPFELNNLADDPGHAADLERLRAALAGWEKLTGDKIPDLRTADEFDRVTGVPTAARVRPRWDKKRMVEAGLTAP
jgi:N-sulfoglucosamine sulfohydrolase